MRTLYDQEGRSRPRVAFVLYHLPMFDTANSMDALKLISDWAKWLIAVQTGAIGLIGGLFKPTAAFPKLGKILVSSALGCFVISIAAAALLLLSLPEIAQTLDGRTNIWLTRDSIIGRVFGANTQAFAFAESLFFGLGVVLIAILIVAAIWNPSYRSA